jgi:hypothetical protein
MKLIERLIVKVGEVWKPKRSSKMHLGKVVIIRIEIGTIMGGKDEPYDPEAEYVCFKYLNGMWESGHERNEFIKLYERDYQ